MSKRLLRIFPPTLLASLPTLLNQKLNVVLFNGHSVFGRLASFSVLDLQLSDLRNHTHEIKLADIEEIILDRQSARPSNLA